MQLRRFVNQNRHKAIVLSIVAIVVCAVVLVGRSVPDEPSTPPELVSMAWFFDRNTGELLPLPDTTEGPVETDSGQYNGQPAGVRAHVYSCGSCYRKADRFVGWLEIPAQFVSASRPPDEPSGEDLEQGDGVERLMVRAPKGETWVPLNSSRADAIMKAVNRCAEGDIRYCRPRPRPWPQQE